MITHIYSYNPHSEGAATLAAEMGIKRIRHTNSRFKGSSRRTVINWGSSNLPEEILKCNVINKPEAVAVVSNKLTFFQTVKDKVSIPPFTTSYDEAMNWIKEGKIVVARTKLQGSGGDGIVLMSKDNPENFVRAPLYTMYVLKADEFRIHIVNGAVTDVQRKALRSNWMDENPDQKPNWRIRNLENGFIYMRNGVVAPDCVITEAVKAVKESGLDFGAVDVIFNQHQGKAYVLEVNSAPGVEGTSAVNYSAAFKDMNV